MNWELARKVINFAGMDVGWAACVLGAASGRGWIGPVAVALLAGLHFALNRGGWAEVRMLVAVAAVGFVADSAMGLAGFYAFAGGAWLCPAWLVAMWVNLGLTLNSSLRFLAGKHALSALLGLVGGPLAYYAGARLGALDFPSGTAWALVATGVVWAVAFPALMMIREATMGRVSSASPDR